MESGDEDVFDDVDETNVLAGVLVFSENAVDVVRPRYPTP